MDKYLNKQIEEDVFRYFGNGSRPFLYKLRVPAIKYTITLRKIQYYKKANKKFRWLLNEIKTKLYASRYLIQIPTSTKIGRGLYIGHMGSVIINKDSILGDNVNLSTGVTIGQTNRGSKKGCPTIGNKVWVGTNAVIVGNINIGDNVLIAPNAYVNMDVPSDSIVVGNPAKITPNENATDNYVHNII